MTFTWGQGGYILYGPDQLGAIKNAITEFSKVTDTNATLISVFFYSSGEVCPLHFSLYRDRDSYVPHRLSQPSFCSIMLPSLLRGFLTPSSVFQINYKRYKRDRMRILSILRQHHILPPLTSGENTVRGESDQTLI
jgi:hypothetical protein